MWLWLLTAAVLQQGALVCGQRDVSSARELAEALKDGAESITIQSRITGNKEELLTAEGGWESDGRYKDFPPVPFLCC